MNSGNDPEAVGESLRKGNSTTPVPVVLLQLVCASSIVDGEVEVETEKGDCESGQNDDGNPAELLDFEDEDEPKRKGRKSCLVCLAEMQIDPDPGLEGLLSSHEGGKVPLIAFCDLLKVKMPPKAKSLLKSFDTPLCSGCADEVMKIKALLVQIEGLEGSIRVTRALIKDKVASCSKDFESQDVDTQSATASSEIVRAINRIRSNIKQTDMLSGPAIHKTPGRKPGQKVQRSSAKPDNMEDIRREGGPISNVKSSFGRVVKRPRYLLKTVSDEEFEEEDEQKFDVDDQEQGIAVAIVKTEVTSADADPGPAVPIDESKLDHKISKIEAMPDTNGSEGEFQLSLSDTNWSDDDLLDDRKEKKPIRNPKRRKRKQTRKKGKTKCTQVQLVGANGENLGGGVVRDGKVIIDHNPQMKLTKKKNLFKGKSENMQEKKIECKANQTFTDADKMELHISKTHGKDQVDYSCKSCNKTFSKIVDLRIHKRTEHCPKLRTVGEDGRRKFECEFCPCVFKNSSDLLIHNRTHTGEKPFSCDTCDKAFISKRKYEAHVEVSHPDVPPLKCEVCPRSFFRHHRLRDHQKSHTGERPYLCEICSKAFSQPAYLKYHQTQHKELNRAEYKCSDCDKKFASPVNLRYHKETQHQRIYRYYCDVCGHGATHLSHMKLHKLSHTGEKPHSCLQCGKCFTRPAQLKIHIRSHTGERPYACKTCGKAFTNSSKLRRHEITHSTIKSKRSREVKGTHPSGSGSGSNILIAEQVVEVKIEDSNGQPIPKMEQGLPSIGEQEMQRQLITIEQPDGITYQVIAANETGNSDETYTEYIVLNGDFTIS